MLFLTVSFFDPSARVLTSTPISNNESGSASTGGFSGHQLPLFSTSDDFCAIDDSLAKNDLVSSHKNGRSIFAKPGGNEHSPTEYFTTLNLPDLTDVHNSAGLPILLYALIFKVFIHHRIFSSGQLKNFSMDEPFFYSCC
jgi:hypothetical protein